MKKNYEMGINDIAMLKTTYNQYDMTIYLYLLRLISGNFNEASEGVLSITQNLYPEVVATINESDFGFYATLTLLINFRRNFLREIQSDSKTLIYKIHEDYTNYFDILESYSKCRFDVVCVELDKMKERIQTDPFLAANAGKIYLEIKNNMIKEILRACSTVSIQYLSGILKESEDKVENMILLGIRNNVMKACIDDIDHIVYSREPKTLNTVINKTLDVSKEIYNTSIMRLTDRLVKKNAENIMTDIDQDTLKYHKLEREKGGKDFRSMDQMFDNM